MLPYCVYLFFSQRNKLFAKILFQMLSDPKQCGTDPFTFLPQEEVCFLKKILNMFNSLLTWEIFLSVPVRLAQVCLLVGGLIFLLDGLQWHRLLMYVFLNIFLIVSQITLLYLDPTLVLCVLFCAPLEIQVTLLLLKG